jgi:hypothetical protein
VPLVKFRRFQRRARHLARSPRILQIFHRRHAARRELLQPRDIAFRLIRRAARLRDLRFDLLRLQPRQHLPARHAIAHAHRDRLDHAADLEREFGLRLPRQNPSRLHRHRLVRVAHRLHPHQRRRRGRNPALRRLVFFRP